jgi:hypothetical protein
MDDLSNEEVTNVIDHIAKLREHLTAQRVEMQAAMVPPSSGTYVIDTFMGYSDAIVGFFGVLLDIAEFIETFLQGMDITARTLSDVPTQDS